MTDVAVVAHSRKSFGGGLAELRRILTVEGVTDPGSVTLTGALTTLLSGTQAGLPGVKVTITRTVSGAGEKQTETLTAITAADGTFTVTHALPVHGSYTYTASFAGDSANAPAAPAVVTVAGRPGKWTLAP